MSPGAMQAPYLAAALGREEARRREFPQDTFRNVLETSSFPRFGDVFLNGMPCSVIAPCLVVYYQIWRNLEAKPKKK
jgi:hypothetical protein